MRMSNAASATFRSTHHAVASREEHVQKVSRCAVVVLIIRVVEVG